MLITILLFHYSPTPMRFAIVTSSISAALIAIVSAISIAVLSWVYSAGTDIESSPENKVEILWGQGS